MLGIDCSMSRTGCCYDNAVMERFYWSLEQEWTNHDQFQNLEAARLSVFKYFETLYNSQRLHQTLNYRAPNQFEAEHARLMRRNFKSPPLSKSPGLSQSN